MRIAGHSSLARAWLGLAVSAVVVGLSGATCLLAAVMLPILMR